MMLPPAGIKRWHPYRKAEVVNAVRGGAISFEDACERYDLSVEELEDWQARVQAAGTSALKVTRASPLRKRAC